MAILKPGKDADVLDSYKPIALLSVVYKLLEKLFGLRINDLIDAAVPSEQAGFQGPFI